MQELNFLEQIKIHNLQKDNIKIDLIKETETYYFIDYNDQHHKVYKDKNQYRLYNIYARVWYINNLEEFLDLTKELL
jgi:hypothetical protein